MFDSSFWLPIASAAIQALLLMLIPVVIGAVGVGIRYLWSKIKAEKPLIAEFLAEYARQAVYAAEQLGAIEQITNKKQYAIELVKKYCKTAGLSVDVDLIEAAIEAAVSEEFNLGRDYTKAEIDSVKKRYSVII